MTRQRGFTLVEVVVAFLMLAMVLATSYELFSTGLRRAGDLEDYSRALAIAQSQLSEASYGETFEEGQVSGQSDDGRFQWTLARSRYEEPVDPSNAQQHAFYPVRLAVRVTWRSGSEQERQLDLSTLVVGKIT
jgi:general secretion pathway protein I